MTDSTPDTDTEDGDGETASSDDAPGTDLDAGAEARTDGPSPAPDGASAAAPTSDEPVDSNGSGSDSAGSRLVVLVQWAAFGILSLLALVSTFRFYFAVSEAIRVWFTPDYVPIFQAVFSLVVLIASAIGISILVRRLG